MRRALAFALLALLGIVPAGCRVHVPAEDVHPATAPLATTAVPNVLREADRVRLAEAFRLADALRDSVWEGWSRAPFAVLLVTPDEEILLRHPRPTEDFRPLGYDSLLNSEVHVRARQFPPNLLASFPAVAGIPTVVIGQPENTDRTSTAWILTLLHEHFHQLQYSQPGYYAGVDALDLSGGDQTGMWMLNYPFPYDTAVVQGRFASMARALVAALEAKDSESLGRYLAAFHDARAALRQVLSEPDYRYLAFQEWQEGGARYTEYQVARLAADRYDPTPAFRRLPDFTSFEDAANALSRGILGEGTESVDLGQQRRVAFYSVGAATALLLDRAAPGWKERYFAEPFLMDRYFRTEAE